MADKKTVRGGVLPVKVTFAADDFRQLAWLCQMAAVGCVHENRSGWAAQLRLDAKMLREIAGGAA